MKRSKLLKIKPKWDEVEKVRNKSGTFLKSLGLSNDTIHTLTMVISELVENSIKYGNFTLPDNRIIVNINLGEKIITIEVANPIDESVFNHLKKLDKTIQWIRGYQDPFESYIERLKEVSKKPLSDEESGLGLVRIAYEGRAILDFFVGEDDNLNVSAVSNY